MQHFHDKKHDKKIVGVGLFIVTLLLTINVYADTIFKFAMHLDNYHPGTVYLSKTTVNLNGFDSCSHNYLMHLIDGKNWIKSPVIFTSQTSTPPDVIDILQYGENCKMSGSMQLNFTINDSPDGTTGNSFTVSPIVTLVDGKITQSFNQTYISDNNAFICQVGLGTPISAINDAQSGQIYISCDHNN